MCHKSVSLYAVTENVTVLKRKANISYLVITVANINFCQV